MKINEIITSYDIEKVNYLKALNPGLSQINKDELLLIAKRSTIKELIKKKEIQKYKKLNLQNPQIDDVLKNLIQNLKLRDENQLKDYIKNFDLTVNDLKRKIEIENELKNLIYSRYIKTVKINKKKLIEKIEKNRKVNFFEEYNLSEIVFTKKDGTYINDLSEKIKKSIEINGFENTANFTVFPTALILGVK